MEGTAKGLSGAAGVLVGLPQPASIKTALFPSVSSWHVCHTQPTFVYSLCVLLKLAEQHLFGLFYCLHTKTSTHLPSVDYNHFT